MSDEEMNTEEEEMGVARLTLTIHATMTENVDSMTLRIPIANEQQ